jgi:hypothetical protein
VKPKQNRSTGDSTAHSSAIGDNTESRAASADGTGETVFVSV